MNVLVNSIHIIEKQAEEQKNIIENQKKLNEEHDKKLNSIMSANIPLGFLYTQFPNQSKPEDLWPNTKWSEMTSQYSGLFFRAEGVDSEPFGRIQLSNRTNFHMILEIVKYSTLSNVNYIKLLIEFMF